MQEGPWATALSSIYILLLLFKVYTILYSTSTWATTLPTIYQSLQAVLRTSAFMLQHSVKHKFWNVCRMVSRLQHNSFFFSDLKLTPLLSTQCTRWSVGWRTETIKFCWTNFFGCQYPGWTGQQATKLQDLVKSTFPFSTLNRTQLCSEYAGWVESYHTTAYCKTIFFFICLQCVASMQYGHPWPPLSPV